LSAKNDDTAAKHTTAILASTAVVSPCRSKL